VAAASEHNENRRATGNTITTEDEPSDGKRMLLPDVTVEKAVYETPLPHANVSSLIPQLPFDEVMVKLEPIPEIVNVASV